jgi:hypothetical protein
MQTIGKYLSKDIISPPKSQWLPKQLYGVFSWCNRCTVTLFVIACMETKPKNVNSSTSYVKTRLVIGKPVHVIRGRQRNVRVLVSWLIAP